MKRSMKKFSICVMITAVTFGWFLMEVKKSEAREISRPKRWSTTLTSKPAEQHECKSDADCSGISYTSCAIDDSDKKFKCLCADHTQPNNGACKKRPKELKTPCAEDYECLPGAACQHETEESRTKVCICQDDYIEVNKTCVSNGCNFISAAPITILVGAIYAIYRMY